MFDLTFDMITLIGLKWLILEAALSALPPAKHALSVGDDCYQINITASNRPNIDLLFDKPNVLSVTAVIVKSFWQSLSILV